MESISVYDYIKNLLIESGIDFKNIDRNDIIATCKTYPGEIDQDNYMLLLKVIDEFYENGTKWY